MGATSVRGTCTVKGCDRPHKAHGLCASHYKQHRRGSKIVPLNPHVFDHADTCTVAGCDGVHVAKGLCQTHYKRQRRHGSVDAVFKPWGAGH